MSCVCWKEATLPSLPYQQLLYPLANCTDALCHQYIVGQHTIIIFVCIVIIPNQIYYSFCFNSFLDDGDDEDKKKKKKKKKGEKEEKDLKDKKGPGKKTLAAMKEALQKLKEEEERLKIEEEERIKKLEEAETQREEQVS